MDANGARFWLLARATDWTSAGGEGAAEWDGASATLRLASRGAEPVLSEDAVLARARLDLPPRSVDGFGAEASVVKDGAEWRLRVRQEGLDDTDIFVSEHAITDAAEGADGVVTVAAHGALWVRDSRTFGDADEAWRAIPAIPGFEAWRVACGADGGAWVLDRAHRLLARWRGTVLRTRPLVAAAPGVFRLDPYEPVTISLRVVAPDLGGDDPVALAVSPEGRVAVLALRPDAEARVHRFTADGAPDGVARLAGVRHPFSVAFVGESLLAVLATDHLGEATGSSVISEALVYPLETTLDSRLLPVGERYPLRRHDGGPFLHDPKRTAAYPTPAGPRPLVPLSLPCRATIGAARGRALDGGRADTCWHRLYLEAAVPEGCGIRVWLAATNAREAPGAETPWYAHDLGDLPALRAAPWAGEDDAGAWHLADPGEESARPPRAGWHSQRSEIPGQTGLLRRAADPGRAGLFSALIQRSGRRSTGLLGRFLHVRVELHGTGYVTPELAAVRAWANRFSYVRRYLPELYHEDPAVDGADEPGKPTAADFLERFVAMFEGVLTPMEDAVAEAWTLTHPRSAPAEALEWLASWVGRSLDPALPEAARRRMLAFAPELSRCRGTRRGLEMALEVVTDGGVSDGRVVVLEEWRLRRTWATILGADLADETDPLMEGLVVSGNSIVGDTLALGEEHHREFLALFGPQAATTKADRKAVADLFRKAAWRVTILASDDVDAATLALVRRTVTAETPAHLVVSVKVASRRFTVGVAALVGVHTRLGDPPPVRTVRLGSTRIGAGDRLRRPPGLHPDFEGEGG